MLNKMKDPIDVCLENGFSLNHSDDGINGGSYYEIIDEKGNKFAVTIEELNDDED